MPRRCVPPLFLALALVTAAAVWLASPAVRAAGAPARPLSDALNAIIASGDLGGARLGIRVVEADTGRVVFDHNPEMPLKPASNAKILTSAAALSLLRPEYIFTTGFSTLGRPAASWPPGCIACVS